jgi:hypothetical protein
MPYAVTILITVTASVSASVNGRKVSGHHRGFFVCVGPWLLVSTAWGYRHANKIPGSACEPQPTQPNSSPTALGDNLSKREVLTAA